MQLFRHLSKDHSISSCVKCHQDQGFFLFEVEGQYLGSDQKHEQGYQGLTLY